MQTTPAPAPAPASPAVVGTPQPTTAPPGVPTTAREVRAIRQRREELSNQLQSAEGRRNRLADQLQAADVTNRAGIEDRIRLLDERIVQLETDIAETGRLLTSAPPEAYTSTEARLDRVFGVIDPDDVTGLSLAFIFFVMMPVALAYARRIWRRAPKAPPEMDEVAGRLTRIEQAVDAVAIEVERISEGQRYVTRVLAGAPAADGEPGDDARGFPALGPGQQPAEPVRVPVGERVAKPHRR